MHRLLLSGRAFRLDFSENALDIKVKMKIDSGIIEKESLQRIEDIKNADILVVIHSHSVKAWKQLRVFDLGLNF